MVPDPELVAKLEKVRAQMEKRTFMSNQNFFDMYYRPRNDYEEPATPPASNFNRIAVNRSSKNFKQRKWATVGSNTSKNRPYRTPRKGRKTRKARKTTSPLAAERY